MSGRLGHIDDARRVGHLSKNKIRTTNYAYGFGNCKYWLDASLGLNTNTNLAAVDSWVEKINGINYVQATGANQPRFILSDAAFNNYPVIEFYSNARFLAAVKGYPVGPYDTLVLVYQKTSSITGSSRESIFGDGNTGVNAGFHLVSNTSTSGVSTNYFGWTAQGRQITSAAYYAESSGAVNNLNSQIIVLSGLKFFVDGVELSGSYIGSFPWAGFEFFRFNSNGATLCSTFKLADLVIYNGVLSSVDGVKLSDNINSKYSIY
jgi:hypothetical protein